MSEPLVIIGNGMAATRLVEELVRQALGRYAIAVIGDEPRLAYNRVLLSSVLAQEVSKSDVELRPAAWWRDRGVTLLYGHRAVSIDSDIRRVKLASGATLPFTKLVLATGSRAVRPRVPGIDLPGVMTFRDLGDVGSIEAAAAPGSKAVVIGGGLLGLEAGLRPRQGRGRCFGRASDGPLDGAATRCACGRDAQKRGRGQGHRCAS